MRQPASAPARLRDPTLISSALQSLTDEARCADHRKAAEFEAIIRQRRSLLYRPEYGDIIIRLFGTKEETAVASTIAKMVKGTRQPLISTPDGGGHGTGWRQGRGRMVCFSCGRPGHFQIHCPSRNSNIYSDHKPDFRNDNKQLMHSTCHFPFVMVTSVINARISPVTSDHNIHSRGVYLPPLWPNIRSFLKKVQYRCPCPNAV